MNSLTNIFINKLDERGFNYKIKAEHETFDEICIFYPIESSRCSLKNVDLNCIVSDYYIQISSRIAQVSRINADEAVKTLNKLNYWYRFVSYSTDENNIIYAHVDFQFHECCVEYICFSAISRIVLGITEDLWPAISKYI